MKDNKDLVELLRRFATKYGAEIEIAGQKGAFFLYSDKPAPKGPSLNNRVIRLAASARWYSSIRRGKRRVGC